MTAKTLKDNELKDNESQKTSLFSSIPSLNKLKPNLPSLPSKPSFIQKFVSLLSDLPPMSIFVLSNVCYGALGGAGDLACNHEE